MNDLYSVRIIRPDGTETWISDEDHGQKIWVGSFEEAKQHADVRAKYYRGTRYIVTKVKSSEAIPPA